jgi:hypothetical protein
MVRVLALLVVVGACAEPTPVEEDDPCSDNMTRTIDIADTDDGFKELIEECRTQDTACRMICDAVFAPGAENQDYVEDCEVEIMTDTVRVSGRVFDFEACDG